LAILTLAFRTSFASVSMAMIATLSALVLALLIRRTSMGL
jgi:hypothetical protein